MRVRCSYRRASLALLLVVLWGCTRSQTPAGESEDALLHAGIEALYTRHDPQAAAIAFRKVLAQNPAHYGATYQLATALDQLHQPAEADAVWQKVLVMANGYQDTATADTVRTRLGQPKPTDAEALMQAGLADLDTRHDPAAAATAFRKILKQNPSHYGATFQLARALDAAGERGEARVLWEKMLQMAEAAQDQPTIDTVHARLTTTP